MIWYTLGMMFCCLSCIWTNLLSSFILLLTKLIMVNADMLSRKSATNKNIKE